jgi:hypothetical protein
MDTDSKRRPAVVVSTGDYHLYRFAYLLIGWIAKSPLPLP